MIETFEGNHSANMDELLTYLDRESRNRIELAIANYRRPDQADREMSMAVHYKRMYDAARHYRKLEAGTLIEE